MARRYPLLMTMCQVAVLAGAALGPPPAFAEKALPYPAATPEETARVVASFKAAAKRSLGPRGGDLFALPSKYCYIVEGSYIRTSTSTVYVDGQEVVVAHKGSHHGTLWDYDTRIPLSLYGAGYVNGGRASLADATQQDIVPTIAHVLGAVPPEDAAGRVLKEALKPAAKPPKVVLVLLFDQGGLSMLDAHPASVTPFVRSLGTRGFSFSQAKVTHIDPETIVGHTAIGTGAYPNRTGVSANRPWIRMAAEARMAILGENGANPAVQESPTLADVWLKQTKNQAVVIGQSLADRAAIGMIGHGAGFKGNKKPIVNYYDEKLGHWTTNTTYFAQPAYVTQMKPSTYWTKHADAQGKWRGHVINNVDDFRRSPAAAAYDGDAMMAMIQKENVGSDEVPDLIFWSEKASDYVAHRFGLESLEERDVLAVQDANARRVVEYLEKKVGADRLLVIHSADHGGAPLAELAGGVRFAEAALLKAINARFDKKDDGIPLAQHVTSTQIYLDDAEMAASGTTLAEIKAFVKGIRVEGRPFFAAVFDREELAQ